MTKSIHKPLIVKFVVRHVGTSVGPSEVVRELTGYMEDVTEAVGILRDFLSMTKSIHKPDRRDINGYRFLIHLFERKFKEIPSQVSAVNSSLDSEDF